MPAPASQTRVPMTTAIRAANLPYFFMQDLLKSQYTLIRLWDIQTFLTFLWESSTCPQVGAFSRVPSYLDVREAEFLSRKKAGRGKPPEFGDFLGVFCCK